MKITHVSLQSKLDELLSFFHTYYSMKITRISLQSKLDEGYVSTVKSVHPTSIAVKHALFYRRIRVNIEISSSNFDCNETRVIFIGEDAYTMTSVHPTSFPQADSLPGFH